MTDVRIVTEPLGGSALSEALQRGETPEAWMSRAPRGAAAWRAHVSRRAGERTWHESWSALDVAFGATGAAAARLRRVRESGGVVVTTGQQPGLFGGPVYTWSKAMSALALADAIERTAGIATAAVFWAATDDADFAEASYAIIARSGGTETLRTENAPPAGTPMALAPLGELSSLIARLRDATGSASDPRALDAVQRSYGSATRTIGESYVALLRELLAPLGVPVLDASHPAVRDTSTPTLIEAMRRAPMIEAALDVREREIRAAGLAPQVESVSGLSLVFVREGSVKRRVSVVEAARVASDTQAWLTPNVLLRPIVEQAILPTIAYLGGPGELAYFAQSSAVADALGMNRPLALPRWSCTLIEPQIEQLLSRFGVTPDALARPDALEGAVARERMSDESARAIAALRSVIDATPASLAGECDALGLTAAIRGAALSLQHRVDRLERRVVAGIKRRERDLLHEISTLRGALYPDGTRQERALSLIPLLGRHGLGLLSEMHAAASAHAHVLLGAGSSSD